jgi:hypothetical protein
MAFTTFAENLTKSLEPMLASYSATLLQKISEDYSLSYEELSTRYLTTPAVPVPKAKGATGTKKKTAKAELPQCSGLTAKGEQCKHKAFDESGLCRIHQKKANGPESQATPSKEPKKKEPKKKKGKEPAPVHTHEVGESSELCGLCESHGNPMNPELPSATFESDGLADRLKALIMAEGEDEIPDAEPAVEEELQLEEEAEESDYEDEGEALTQALRNLVMEE